MCMNKSIVVSDLNLLSKSRFAAHLLTDQLPQTLSSFSVSAIQQKPRYSFNDHNLSVSWLIVWQFSPLKVKILNLPCQHGIICGLIRLLCNLVLCLVLQRWLHYWPGVVSWEPWYHSGVISYSYMLLSFYAFVLFFKGFLFVKYHWRHWTVIVDSSYRRTIVFHRRITSSSVITSDLTTLSLLASCVVSLLLHDFTALIGLLMASAAVNLTLNPIYACIGNVLRVR